MATVPSRYKIAQLRLQSLVSERDSYDAHWKDLQSFFLTRRGRWIDDTSKSKGGKRNQKLVDPTPRFCARTLGAGMHAGSTNPATPWFRFKTPDPEMMEFPAVSRWLYLVENAMREVFEKSNLYSVLPGIYAEAGVFGTGSLLMPEHKTRVVHFIPKTIGSFYQAADTEGTIDTMYCQYKMTVRQLMADYGDKVPTIVQAQARDQQLQSEHRILHVIEPNSMRREAFDNQNMPFSSVHFLMGSSDDTEPLRISGYEDNIIASFRWETTEITDAYGSSAGMDALGSAQAMQTQTRRKAQAIDKLIDPPMVGDPALQNQPSSLMPGDVTYAGFTPTGSAPKFQPAYTIKPELPALLEDIQDTRELVQTAMYTDLFLAITLADPRNATVPEIDARKEEQILALGPVLQNHQDGLIKKIIDRTFNIMMRQGRLPPPPPELEGVDLKVQLIGALAQAFMAIAGGKIERFTNFVGVVAKTQAESGQEVTAFDKWDTDQSIDEYAQAIGVPPTVVRSDDAVAEIREQRAKAQQAQAAAQAAPALKDASVAAKNLSETDVGGQSALEAMTDAA